MRKQLADARWKRIEGLLPGKIGDPGSSGEDNRLFVEAVLWIARTGSPWRDLPPEFGSWNSTYQRFARWSRAGVWHRVFAALARERRFREVFIDSTIVRAHQHAAGASKRSGAQALGRSRGGLTTKIHVVVDAIGRLIQGRVSAGHVHDTPRPARCSMACQPSASWPTRLTTPGRCASR
jgi:transposase